jgi:TPR repeat protein
MKTAVRTSLVVLGLSVCLADTAFADQLAEASAAFKLRDYATAIRLCRQPAEGGNKWCQMMLAEAYYHGTRVPQDYPEAMKWYRKAAEQGGDDAQFSLANGYEHGQGVPQDYAAAVKWYGKAAEQGHPPAQNSLGGMYGSGKGVPQDYVQAHKWYSLAVANVTDDKQRETFVKNRDMLAAKMTPTQIAEARKLAREWKPSR